jgi:Rrf2 family protein
MRLRPQAQCALRVLVALAGDALPNTAEDLALKTKTSPGLVDRTLAALTRARIVKPVGDGYRLGFHPRAIYVADIIDATGALDESLSCPLASPTCTAQSQCALCWTLFEADLAAMQVLRTQTVDDLRRAPHNGALHMPRSA